jgi:hypothetical protein
MSGDYASFGYLDDEPAAFARFPLALESGPGARLRRRLRRGHRRAR